VRALELTWLPLQMNKWPLIGLTATSSGSKQ
jgi:hypothetical protein